MSGDGKKMEDCLLMEVREELDDADVMLNWWNEDVALGRYESLRVRGVGEDGTMEVSAFDTTRGIEVEMEVSIADLENICGTLSIAWEGDQYVVTVAGD